MTAQINGIFETDEQPVNMPLPRWLHFLLNPLLPILVLGNTLTLDNQTWTLTIQVGSLIQNHSLHTGPWSELALAFRQDILRIRILTHRPVEAVCYGRLQVCSQGLVIEVRLVTNPPL